MFRRSLLELSARRSVWRIPRQITPQRVPSPFVSFNKEFSTATPQNGNSPPQSGSNFPKVFLASAAVASAALLAFRSGYLDNYIGKEQQHGYVDSEKLDADPEHLEKSQPFGEQTAAATVTEEPRKLARDVDLEAQEVETRADLPSEEVEQKNVGTNVDIPNVEAKERADPQSDHLSSSNMQSENQQQAQQVSDLPKTEDNQDKRELDFSQPTNLDGSIGKENAESKTFPEPYQGIQVTDKQTQAVTVSPNDEANTVRPQHVTTEDPKEVAPLLDAYHLKEPVVEKTLREGLEEQEQAVANAIEKLNDGYITKDGQLVLNFLHAIHEAEKRQAELDARAFAEEKRILKEEYENEIRDSRARLLMREEEVAMLEKEIKREKARAAAAFKSLQEKMEEKLRMELEQKENEAQAKLREIQELAQAEKNAEIAREKEAQIEKIAEANLHISALCLAFYARSEEAQQIHSVHKLALGALALEDALSKGLPIEQELNSLNSYLEGIDQDSLLHLVLSTLPEETRHYGTDTLLQLNQKFNGLKGNLRHYILIPPGGGGIFAHALSQIASWLRFKEVDSSGDGIESLITRVESLLAEGKLAEAADALQGGVQGSQAEEIIGDWVRRARNRAITEQALAVLQSYATCISLTQ